jgi:hypothetical protein
MDLLRALHATQASRDPVCLSARAGAPACGGCRGDTVTSLRADQRPDVDNSTPAVWLSRGSKDIDALPVVGMLPITVGIAHRARADLPGTAHEAESGPYKAGTRLDLGPHTDRRTPKNGLAKPTRP